MRKGQRRFEGFDDKILALYSRGLSVRDIEAHLGEIYGALSDRRVQWHGLAGEPEPGRIESCHTYR